MCAGTGPAPVTRASRIARMLPLKSGPRRRNGAVRLPYPYPTTNVRLPVGPGRQNNGCRGRSLVNHLMSAACGRVSAGPRGAARVGCGRAGKGRSLGSRRWMACNRHTQDWVRLAAAPKVSSLRSRIGIACSRHKQGGCGLAAAPTRGARFARAAKWRVAATRKAAARKAGYTGMPATGYRGHRPTGAGHGGRHVHHRA